MRKLEAANTTCLYAGRNQSRPAQPEVENCIGTLSVSLIECKHLKVNPAHSKSELFCSVRLNRQEYQSRHVPLYVDGKHGRARWNQQLLFSVGSLDEFVFFTLAYYGKYGQDEEILTVHSALDFLEYYGDKDALVELPLPETDGGKLVTKLQYKTQV